VGDKEAAKEHKHAALECKHQVQQTHFAACAHCSDIFLIFLALLSLQEAKKKTQHEANKEMQGARCMKPSFPC
jgi:hypothetical protein